MSCNGRLWCYRVAGFVGAAAMRQTGKELPETIVNSYIYVNLPTFITELITTIAKKRR
jgi:hypothetical protein